MQLLPEIHVIQESSAKEVERKARIQRMHDEETAIAARLNVAKAEEEAEAKSLDDRVQKKRNVVATELMEQEALIASRRAELKGLMKPIDEIRKDAEARLEVAKQKEAFLLDLGDVVAENQQVVADRMLALKEREEDVAAKDTSLHAREQNIIAEEKRLKESQNALTDKWTEHYDTIARADADLKRREKEIRDGTKANDVVRESLRGERISISDEKRAIRDAYAALEQAKKHLGIK